MALPFSEIYTALGAGMLAGTKNSIQDVMGMKFDEHIRHLFVDRHAYMASFWWYSEQGWQRLPPDVQQAVREGVIEPVQKELLGVIWRGCRVEHG